MSKEMIESLKQFITNGDELIKNWDDDVDVTNYPAYLPSFDEFVRDMSNFLESCEIEEEYRAKLKQTTELLDNKVNGSNGNWMHVNKAAEILEGKLSDWHGRSESEPFDDYVSIISTYAEKINEDWPHKKLEDLAEESISAHTSKSASFTNDDFDVEIDQSEDEGVQI